MYLSPAHGVNPTCAVCWWCGKDTGTLILTGRKGDQVAKSMGISSGEMPMRCIVDREPCNNCQAHMKTKILVARMRNENAAHHTAVMALTEETFESLGVHPPSLKAAVLEKRAMLMLADAWDQLGLPTEQPEEVSTDGPVNAD